MKMNLTMNNNMLVSTAECPFGSNRKSTIEFPINDLQEKIELEQLRSFFTHHLTDAIKSEVYDQFTTEKLQYLKVQLYQPNSIDTMITKILQFNIYLHGVTHYNDILNFLKTQSKKN